MRLLKLLMVVSVLVCGGCEFIADALKPDPKPGQLRIDAERIAGECGVPVRWLRLLSDRTVALDADPESNDQQIECVISKIDKLPYNVGLAFVGNEAYRVNVQ